MEIIKFDDWKKLDLRVGKILGVEDIEGANKLYKLEIDLGNEKRTLVAGIKPYYKSEELKGKKCIVFTNLEPRKIRGIDSQGMILAAGSPEESLCILISPEKDVESGTKIS